MPCQIPGRRWQNAGDLLSELEWITEAGSKAGIPAPVAARRRNRERIAWLVALLLVSTRFSEAHLYVLPLDGDRKPVPYLNTEFLTQQGQFSPNGRWVAYRSVETGRMEIYVQGFTLDSSQARGKWQVSIAGGELPRWRRDGKELFYHYGDGFFAVDVKTDGASFEAGIPKPLFAVPTVSGNGGGGAPFVVTRDGQRFLVLAQGAKTASEPLEVLVNWR